MIVLFSWSHHLSSQIQYNRVEFMILFLLLMIVSLDHADFDLLESHRLLGLHMLLLQLARWSFFR